MKSLVLALVVLAAPFATLAELPENFRPENLVAWCVAHRWDTADRNPAERAALLSELGIGRLAYNWRTQDNPQFEEEILQCKRNGIEFFAFWNENEEAFALFEKYDLHPQIWKTLQSPKEGSQKEMVEAAVKRILPFAKRAQELGCPFGLYNHGNWGGHPDNLVAVCQALRKLGCDNVGIVYNFHHAHEEMDRFAKYLALMQPYLLCINLNGMVNKDTLTPKSLVNKILPIGSGLHEKKMIHAIVESGYTGPIGIIGHLDDQDADKSLRDNLTGLKLF
jgi:sugar phosphate isomerase/epimerase